MHNAKITDVSLFCKEDQYIQCCVHLTGIQGVVCSCPPGYVGNGQGSNGCVTQGVTDGPCASNPCRNGALCQVLHAITTL